MRLRDIKSRNIVDYEEPALETISVYGVRYRINSSHKDKVPSAFIGLGFGIEDEYNNILANSIIDAKKYYGKDMPIYVQAEIGRCLNKKDFKDHTQISRMYGDGARVTSLDIFNEAKSNLNEENISLTNVLYFAHPGHAFRVEEIGRKQEFKGGIFLPNEVIWPINDPQKHLRNPKAWKKQEWKVRAHHWLFGLVPREL